MPQSFICLHVHIVFSTKGRFPLIRAEFRGRLESYIGGIVGSHRSSLIAAGGTPDHMHLLVSLGKQISVADLVRDIKSNSSSWIHETFPDSRSFAWQTGYGAFGVSYSDLDRVREYIANQEAHHRTRTYQEEFLALLEKHQIPYDPRYIWD
jgi:REP element-mobilizing transposase RayT